MAFFPAPHDAEAIHPRADARLLGQRERVGQLDLFCLGGQPNGNLIPAPAQGTVHRFAPDVGRRRERLRQSRMKGRVERIWKERVKRLFDLLVGGTLLILVSPIIAAVAVVVRLKLGNPILYTETRAGRHGKPFTMFKFRSMHNLADSDGRPLPDELRLTPFGVKLRSWSLDELPELWNVVRGDMSLVGPRPLTTAYLPLYSKEHARRHDVKPGITGLAQVQGRNSISWDARFSLDVHYVDNYTIWLDLKILAKTLERVVRRDGISADGHVTMPEFTGSEDGADGDSGVA